MPQTEASSNDLRRSTGLSPAGHLAWFASGTALFFAIPWLGTDVAALQHDLYYLIYFAAAIAFLTAYVRSTAVDVATLIRRRWRLSVLLGAGAAVFVVVNVWSRDATAGPGGMYLAFEVLWRGAAYGVVDALVLSAFPCLVAYGILRHDLGSKLRKAGYVVIAAVLIWTITASYHLGYDQFRGSEVVAPEIGNTVISVPMLATMNPAGSVAAHSAMHIAATIHVYETDVFLPPRTDAP